MVFYTHLQARAKLQTLAEPTEVDEGIGTMAQRSHDQSISLPEQSLVCRSKKSEVW